jgi:hypothetical protein
MTTKSVALHNPNSAIMIGIYVAPDAEHCSNNRLPAHGQQFAVLQNE